jgi:hypothetical protein
MLIVKFFDAGYYFSLKPVFPKPNYGLPATDDYPKTRIA